MTLNIAELNTEKLKHSKMFRIFVFATFIHQRSLLMQTNFKEFNFNLLVTFLIQFLLISIFVCYENIAIADRQ